MKISTNSNSNSKVALVVALLLYFRCQPFFLWGVEDISRITCSILVPLLCIHFIDLSKKNIIVFTFFFLSFLLVGILRGSDPFRILNLVLLSVIPILKKDFGFQVYKYFKFIFAFLLIFSVISYLIVILTNWQSPIIINPLNSLKGYSYFLYPLLVVPNADYLFYRFHGLFDEPGVVGTIGGLILCIEKFKIKSWQNIVILIASLLSFSFYFYVVLFFVSVYHFNGKYRIYIILAFITFYLISSANDTIDGLIWSRFSVDTDNNTLAGMNRGEEQIKDILQADSISNYLLGHGYQASEEFMEGASIYLTIFREGFLFVVLNLLGYLIAAFNKLFQSKADFILFILILVGTFYQRPALFDFVYIFLFATMINKFASDVELINNEL